MPSIKKQTIALLPVGFVLTVSLVALTTFQNCSNVSFRTTKSTPESALATIQKSCTDANGVEHMNGDAWVSSESDLRAVICPDAANSNQGYDNQTSWICQNGDISIAGNDTKLVPPMSACPAPALTASASNPKPQSGGSSDLLVTSQAVHDVKYNCRSVATGSSIKAGDLIVGSDKATLQTIVEDLQCSVTAQTSSTPIEKTVDINVDCESSGKLKDPTTHMCIDFACKSFVALTPTSANNSNFKFEIPARSVAGVCYTAKLMNAISKSKSNLTVTRDLDVVDHDHDANQDGNPYLMGRANVEFLMKAGGGARQVKLSGSGSQPASILVDNFVLVGLAKKSIGLSLNNVYNAYGSNDSTIDGTNILLRNRKLVFKSFGQAGVQSIGTFDITTQVSTEESYLLDVRALDAGVDRELSDIYLLFQ